ncbi:3-phosphoserine/phosphohydroxythreonine transaminase [Sutcliffiella cohnii]|uniref:3-phosphoserine/phosphohydroxythreonine transaminase n=1 Tax=Sutcliffiella cohnii TaxID=33932 RepID=UPI002E1EF026|nr:3-phosphoserine/phosphohydroxythreonine transaminase [Sutcliffiella cohnii]MED4018616.1 3-phosphoserine/phosphohydroxythreonine transaminase [Sutcliffiella cohnii]
MTRSFNFSAGPSTLPLPVLEKVQKEFLSFQGTGMSIIEISHRSNYFEEIMEQTEQLLREIMNIPNNYKVLFVQGGASLQFSMVPMNLLTSYNTSYYVNTGSWAKKAIAEAEKYGEVHVQNCPIHHIPNLSLDSISLVDYVHITTNNTIEGTKFASIPNTGNVPLVADMSSNILSEEYDVEKFGVIYAGAQKNIGPAGLCIVIVREDLVGQNTLHTLPTMLNYETYVKSNSMYNTPPTFNIYIMKLVLEWLKQLGGVQQIEKINKEKAALLYNFLDESTLFYSNVHIENRSLMNIPFNTTSSQLNEQFISEATSAGFYFLKGHRSIGGMRASLYNAMPIDGVKALVSFMKQFEMKARMSNV